MPEPGEIPQTKATEGNGDGSVCTGARGDISGLVSYFVEHPDSDKEYIGSSPLVEYVSCDEALEPISAPHEALAAKNVPVEVIEVASPTLFPTGHT